MRFRFDFAIQIPTSITQRNDVIEENIDHVIKVGWMRWQMTSEVLCDKRRPVRLKAEYCTTII